MFLRQVRRIFADYQGFSARRTHLYDTNPLIGSIPLPRVEPSFQESGLGPRKVSFPLLKHTSAIAASALAKGQIWSNICGNDLKSMWPRDR